MNSRQKASWYQIMYTAEQRAALPRRAKKRIVEDIMGRAVSVRLAEFSKVEDPIEFALHLLAGRQQRSAAPA